MACVHAVFRNLQLERDIAGPAARLRNLAFDHDRQEPKNKNLFEESTSKEDRFIAFATSAPYFLLVVEETFVVPGYPDASANLQIWRAEQPFEESPDRFPQYGLLVKGERAIHECSLLIGEFENDSNGRHYFGRLECPYIDQILNEYDECLQSDLPFSESNPRLLIDPNRQTSLEQSHLFTAALIQIPAERLRSLLAKDRKKEKPREQEISNNETRNRLNRLGRLAGKFLQEQLEDIHELTEDDDHHDDDSIMRLGMVIYPPFVRVAVDEDRTMTCYVNGTIVGDQDVTIRIEVDETSALAVLSPEILLRPHRSRENVLMGTFQVRGKKPCDAVIISAHGTGLPSAESMAEVVETRIEQHEFVEPLEFERQRYRVRAGQKKSLTLYAKYPDVVSEETDVEVVTSNSNSLPIRGKCTLTPITGSNFARGTVVVQGRRLTQ